MRIDPVKLMTLLVKQDKNMTDLAADCGLSRQTVYGIRGGRKCGKDTAARIAEALSVNIEDLI